MVVSLLKIYSPNNQNSIYSLLRFSNGLKRSLVDYVLLLLSIPGSSTGFTFFNHLAYDVKKTKPKPFAKPYTRKTSTLMKPTASQLARQNQQHQASGTLRWFWKITFSLASYLCSYLSLLWVGWILDITIEDWIVCLILWSAFAY